MISLSNIFCYVTKKGYGRSKMTSNFLNRKNIKTKKDKVLHTRKCKMIGQS